MKDIIIKGFDPHKESLILDADYYREASSPEPDSDGGNQIRLDQDSYIFVFTGRRGGGKTTLMTMMAIRAVVLYGVKLVSNFPIEFRLRWHKDGKTHLETVKSEPLDFEKLMLFDDIYRDCLIVIDEAADIISHLASQSWRNRLTNAFIRQIRKLGISVMLAAQDFHLIDKSIRWQCDIEVNCTDGTRVIQDPSLLRGSVLFAKLYDHSGVWTNTSTEDRIRWGRDPVVERLEVRPCLLWGDDGHNPAFDSWNIIDILESLRRVDLKLSPVRVGEPEDKSFEQRYRVSPHVLTRALNAVDAVVRDRPDEPAIYVKDFYRLCEPMTMQDKLNLGKTLAFYGSSQGGSSAKKYIQFDAGFRLDDFKSMVNSKSEVKDDE